MAFCEDIIPWERSPDGLIHAARIKTATCCASASHGCKPSTLVHLNEEMVASGQVKWQQIKSSCTRQYDNSTNKLGTRLECSQLSFQDHWRWKVTYPHRYIPLVPRSTHRLLISLRICSMDCTPDGWDCEEIYGEKEWMFLAHILLYPYSSEL